MSTAPLDQLRKFPWATFGRRETFSEICTKIEAQKALIPRLKAQPKISIVLPNVSTPDQAHHALLSLQAQSYPNWELVIVGPTTLTNDTKDERVRFLHTSSESTIENKNEGIKKAKGEWVAVIEPNSLLHPGALFELLKQSEHAPEASVIYTNEIQCQADKWELDRFLSKPHFSWFDLIHFNYIGKLWFTKKTNFRQIGFFDLKFEQDHEHAWLLKAHETGKQFSLLPQFLYHTKNDRSPHVSENLLPAIEDHFRRIEFRSQVTRGIHGVETNPSTGAHQLSISVVICFRDQVEWTQKCLSHLAKQTHPFKLKVILCDNRSSTENATAIDHFAQEHFEDVVLVSFDEPFNFSRMNNVAIRDYSDHSDLLFLLNNDVFLNDPSALQTLGSWAHLDWAGTVGMRLHFPDNRIQHGGFQAVSGDLNRVVRIHHAQGDDAYLYQNREVFGNTFAACCFSRATFDKVGGLDPLRYANGYSDVHFNFECLRHQLKNLYLGSMSGTHVESGSRGLSYEFWEEMGIEQQYPDILQQMLRYDLGFDRTAESKKNRRIFLRSTLSSFLGSEFKTLLQFKSSIKSNLGRLGRRLAYSR